MTSLGFCAGPRLQVCTPFNQLSLACMTMVMRIYTHGYVLAVMAVQTLGWRDARALLERLAARPGRETNTGRRDGG